MNKFLKTFFGSLPISSVIFGEFSEFFIQNYRYGAFFLLSDFVSSYSVLYFFSAFLLNLIVLSSVNFKKVSFFAR